MTTTPDTTDLRNLLRALREAGWHHTAKWEDRKGRDADGAPNGEDTEVHRWTRRDAYIEVPRDPQGQIEWNILYEPYGDFTDYEFSFITVGAHWVEQHEGIPGLHRLACALGLLPVELSPAYAIGRASMCGTCEGSGQEFEQGVSYYAAVHGADRWASTGRPCPRCTPTTSGVPA
jgi:hypothetical protein